MKTQELSMLPELSKAIDSIVKTQISAKRKEILFPLIEYIKSKIKQGKKVNLHFICTHNSRRSQFAQIWAQTAAHYYGVQANCYSGGVEVTAFNERAVEAIKRSGFRIISKGEVNPVYFVFFSDHEEPITTFSKIYNDSINNMDEFAAIMTCSHADENCPVIPGAEIRISIVYSDPKEFDNSLMETEKYDERSIQIASEMFYVFSKII